MAGGIRRFAAGLRRARPTHTPRQGDYHHRGKLPPEVPQKGGTAARKRGFANRLTAILSSGSRAIQVVHMTRPWVVHMRADVDICLSLQRCTEVNILTEDVYI